MYLQKRDTVELNCFFQLQPTFGQLLALAIYINSLNECAYFARVQQVRLLIKKKNAFVLRFVREWRIGFKFWL